MPVDRSHVPNFMFIILVVHKRDISTFLANISTGYLRKHVRPIRPFHSYYSTGSKDIDTDLINKERMWHLWGSANGSWKLLLSFHLKNYLDLNKMKGTSSTERRISYQQKWNVAVLFFLFFRERDPHPCLPVRRFGSGRHPSGIIKGRSSYVLHT